MSSKDDSKSSDCSPRLSFEMNQTFPSLSKTNATKPYSQAAELQHSFHEQSSCKTEAIKSTFNFEQRFLCDNALRSITYRPTQTVSCRQNIVENLDRICCSPVNTKRNVSLCSTSFQQIPSSPSLKNEMSSTTENTFVTNTRDTMTNRLNPFRAFLLVDIQTKQIISVNKQACELFWYTENELKTKKITDLIVVDDEKRTHQNAIVDSFLSKDSGQTELIAGKIVDVLLGTGERMPYSMYVQDLENNKLCFYAFESIQMIIANVRCSENGSIVSHDSNFSILFKSAMINSINIDASQIHNIYDFMPSLKKKKLKNLILTKQYRTTGCLNKNKNLYIPLTLCVKQQQTSSEFFDLSISVIMNISGLIIVDEMSMIRAYNPYFVQCLLGYKSLDLINHNINEILSNYNSFNKISLSNSNIAENLSYHSLSDNTDDSDEDGEERSSSSSSLTSNSSTLESVVITPLANRTLESLAKSQNIPQNSVIEPDSKQGKCLFQSDNNKKSGLKSIVECSTSTPIEKRLKNPFTQTLVNDYDDSAVLQTKAKHKNGTFIGVMFAVRQLDLVDGTHRFCVWMTRDNTDPEFIALQKLIVNQQLHDCPTLSLGDLSTSLLDTSQTHKTLESAYVITRKRGRGGYGQVYLGHKINEPTNKVVIKFIKKTKLKLHRYIEHPDYGRILYEIAVLKQLKHPNIVEVIDAYDTENYVQMIMPLHGVGMDLYEFIEKGAQIDEPLCSYIFRQIVDAVSYLHTNHVVHQDIKDENIIINENFHIKLIDFGSARAILDNARCSSNYAGTTEFCCPEFFKTGSCNWISADIWAMFITLYLLIFRRYPFLSPDEIKKCRLDLSIRSNISDELFDLLKSTLVSDPYGRLTMSEIKSHQWILQPVDIEQYHWQVVTNAFSEDSFLIDNNNQSESEHSFASLTRQIQNQFHLFDDEKKENLNVKSDTVQNRYLEPHFEKLSCLKHASL